jgi:flavin reductase (DIM6/NTAB) family NADH-FMN oxidoreductase RutF
MPVTLVGALVDSRVNFLNIAHVGILNSAAPHLISLGMSKSHYTNQGIRENKTFSVNLPSQAMVVEADYVGLVSGRQVDKSGVFETFFGELQTAPLIRNCPLAMECRLREVVDTPAHDVFIGEVVATYADPAVLTNGKVDLAKVQPLLFDMSRREYWTLGQPIAKCWEVGKKLKPGR